MTTTQDAQVRIPQWTFADRMRKVRAETGLSQGDFSARIGVKSSTYATYETGRNEPRFKDVFGLAKRVEKLTGVSASWLIGQPSDYSFPVSPVRIKRKSRPANRAGSTGPKGRTR